MDDDATDVRRPALDGLARLTIGTTFVYLVAFFALAKVGNYAGLYIASAVIIASGFATLVLSLLRRRGRGAARAVAVVCAIVIAVPVIGWLAFLVVTGLVHG